MRELALTGRRMMVPEASELGLVGKVFPNREDCLRNSRQLAVMIASKSPIAVIGTKSSLDFSRDHTVQEGLDHIRTWNVLHLQSKDVMTSVQATLTKSTPVYPRL